MKYFSLMFSFLFLFGVELLAQVPSPTPGLVTDPGNPPPNWLLDLIQNYPKLSAIFMVVGILRVFLKPTFSYLHSVLPGVGLTSWDSEVTLIEQSKPIKFIYFILDYLGSVKVPVKADAQAVKAVS